jgi:hypothetical protein
MLVTCFGMQLCHVSMYNAIMDGGNIISILLNSAHIFFGAVLTFQGSERQLSILRESCVFLSALPKVS